MAESGKKEKENEEEEEEDWEEILKIIDSFRNFIPQVFLDEHDSPTSSAVANQKGSEPNDLSLSKFPAPLDKIPSQKNTGRKPTKRHLLEPDFPVELQKKRFDKCGSSDFFVHPQKVFVPQAGISGSIQEGSTVKLFRPWMPTLLDNLPRPGTSFFEQPYYERFDTSTSEQTSQCRPLDLTLPTLSASTSPMSLLSRPQHEQDLFGTQRNLGKQTIKRQTAEPDVPMEPQNKLGSSYRIENLLVPHISERSDNQQITSTSPYRSRSSVQPTPSLLSKAPHLGPLNETLPTTPRPSHPHNFKECSGSLDVLPMFPQGTGMRSILLKSSKGSSSAMQSCTLPQSGQYRMNSLQQPASIPSQQPATVEPQQSANVASQQPSTVLSQQPAAIAAQQSATVALKKQQIVSFPPVKLTPSSHLSLESSDNSEKTIGKAALQEKQPSPHSSSERSEETETSMNPQNRRNDTGDSDQTRKSPLPPGFSDDAIENNPDGKGLPAAIFNLIDLIPDFLKENPGTISDCVAVVKTVKEYIENLKSIVRVNGENWEEFSPDENDAENSYLFLWIEDDYFLFQPKIIEDYFDKSEQLLLTEISTK